MGFVARRVLGRWDNRYLQSAAAFKAMQRNTPEFLREPFGNHSKGNVLLASIGTPYVPVEAAYLKALEAKGFCPFVVCSYDPWIKDAFLLFGIENVRFFDDYLWHESYRDINTLAEEWLGTIGADWRTWEVDGVPCGLLAGASHMRRTREAWVNYTTKPGLRAFRQELVRSVGATRVAQRLRAEISPQLVMVCDRGYTPTGQLFYDSLANGCPVITHLNAHKSGYAILKRYRSSATAKTHPHSLSGETWRRVQANALNDEDSRLMYDELRGCYISGEWFSEVGTQFNKHFYSREDLYALLKLCRERKTAVIFPHMFWDATFCYGTDLFKNYREWFVEVVKKAAENKHLNWIVKIHPANVVKANRDNYHGGVGELDAIAEVLGKVPDHIFVVPAESNISTFSLFNVMDYCLTVRGTVGIESASLGIRTLTAGTGRFDRLGFTRDFNTKEDYLYAVERLHDIGQMTSGEVALARCYAHALLLRRPVPIDCLAMAYERDAKATLKVRVTAKSREEFLQCEFASTIASFCLSDDEDCLRQRLPAPL